MFGYEEFSIGNVQFNFKKDIFGHFFPYSICMVGPAIVMFMIGFSPNGTECSIAYVETLLCLGMFFNGALSSGHFATPGDLAPNYAGTVFGISNTISGGGIGYVVPVFIGYFTNKNMTFEAWTIVFATASTIYLVTNLFYFFLISGEVQPWNYHVSIKHEYEASYVI